MAMTTVTIHYPESIAKDPDAVADWVADVARQISGGMTSGHVAVEHYWDSDTTS